MTATSHYECSLEQADGLFQLERQRGQDGDSADLYAGGTARPDLTLSVFDTLGNLIYISRNSGATYPATSSY